VFWIWVDGIGALISLSATILFVKGNYHGWKFSLLASMASAWLMWHKSLYALFLLQCCHMLFSVYGWINWRKRCDANQRVLVKCRWDFFFLMRLIIAISVLNWFLTWLVFDLFSHHAYAFDTLIAALFFVCQWLGAQRYLLCWLGWLVGDVCSIALYWHYQTPFHAVLMLCYVPLAIHGFMTWKRLAAQQKEQGEVEQPMQVGYLEQLVMVLCKKVRG
jgi:nicotinamide mononucleotide transporter